MAADDIDLDRAWLEASPGWLAQHPELLPAVFMNWVGSTGDLISMLKARLPVEDDPETLSCEQSDIAAWILAMGIGIARLGHVIPVTDPRCAAKIADIQAIMKAMERDYQVRTTLC